MSWIRLPLSPEQYIQLHPLVYSSCVANFLTSLFFSFILLLPFFLFPKIQEVSTQLSQLQQAIVKNNDLLNNRLESLENFTLSSDKLHQQLCNLIDNSSLLNNNESKPQEKDSYDSTLPTPMEVNQNNNGFAGE